MAYNVLRHSRAMPFRASAWMRWLYRDLDTEPCTHASLNRIKLIGGERPKVVHQANCRNGHNSLRVECARAQESGGDSDLETGLSNGGRVRNDRHERSVRFLERDAENNARTDLCGQAQVNHIPFAAKRRSHPLASWRSSS